MPCLWPLLGIPLAVGCSRPVPAGIDPNSLRARQAIAAASAYATQHYGAPPCSDTRSNWKYGLRQEGGRLISDIGPNGARSIHIVMRAGDLRVIAAWKSVSAS